MVGLAGITAYIKVKYAKSTDYNSSYKLDIE